MITKRFFSKLTNILMVSFISFSIVPLITLSLFFLYNQSAELNEQSHNRLMNVRDIREQQVISYFQAKRSEVIKFSRSELAISSGGKFYGLVAAFEHLGSSVDERLLNAQNRYVEGLGNVLTKSNDVDSPNYKGNERYRVIHDRYHSRYIDLLSHSDFSDVLLVNVEGTVVYSANKSNHYGTNLLSGKHKEDAVAHTFSTALNKVETARAKESPVTFSDFNRENDEMVSWFAAPIHEEGHLHSIILFKLTNNSFTEMINRFPIPDIQTIITNDQSETRINLDRGLLNIHSKSIQEAIKGSDSIAHFIDVNGVPLIAAYSPVNVLGKKWAISIELAEGLAYARYNQLESMIYLTLMIAIVIILIGSFLLSKFVTAPILNLAWVSEQIAAGDLSQQVNGTDREDEIGRLAISFDHMKNSIREKMILIQRQNTNLQQSDKFKDEFLATTSSELHTPLHGMLGICETLTNGTYGQLTASQLSQISLISNSGERLNRLIDDLMDHQKMRDGNLKLERSAVDINASINIVLELSKHLLKEKTIKVINQAPANMAMVYADILRLEQVLYNLIGNAIKYTDKGQVIVNCQEVDGSMRIQVVDSGKGMDAEQLAFISSGEQYSSENSRTKQGSGLGLSITRQLIALMGGRLVASSEVNTGSTFSFTLPLATEAQKDALKPDASENHFDTPESIDYITATAELMPENPDAPLLIIAGNDDVSLQVLISFLHLEGYRVKTTMQSQRTIELIEEEKPALLLLDVMMPDMSGYEVCRILRKIHASSELPIIMLTSLNQTKERMRGFEAGANDYVTKPFIQRELIERINIHIQASKTTQIEIKNSVLEHKIKYSDQNSSSLVQSQQQLFFYLLESSQAGILCIDAKDKIQFVNNSAVNLLKCRAAQVLNQNIDQIVTDGNQNLSINEEQFIEINIDGKAKNIKAAIINLARNSALQSMYIFFTEDSNNTARFENIKKAINTISKFAFDGDRSALQELRELDSDFLPLANNIITSSVGEVITSTDNSVTSTEDNNVTSTEDNSVASPEDKKLLRRATAVELFNTAIDYWEKESGKDKLQLAKGSKLWRVHLEKGVLQTKTLDKYLSVETLPKAPRWKTILSTIDYVLENCKNETKERENVKATLDKLQYLLND